MRVVPIVAEVIASLAYHVYAVGEWDDELLDVGFRRYAVSAAVSMLSFPCRLLF